MLPICLAWLRNTPVSCNAPSTVAVRLVFVDAARSDQWRCSWRRPKRSGPALQSTFVFFVVMLNIRYLIYVICNGAPAGDVAAAEAYGEELFRLETICSTNHDFDDNEEDAELVAVAVNNMAYICKDLGTERFAPFFQRCIEVMAKLLSSIPPSEDSGDDAVLIGLIDAVSDAIETLASVYTTAFLPALPVLFPAISALASTGSSGEH